MLPLTRNGRVASPESVMAGAAIPPSAEALAVWTVDAAEAVPLAAATSTFAATGWTVTVTGGREVHEVASARTAAAVVAGSSTKIVLVTMAHVDAVSIAATARAVVVGSSTKMVLVTTEQMLSGVATGLTPAALLATGEAARAWLTAVTTALELAGTVVVKVASETTDPVTETLAATVTVPVT